MNNRWISYTTQNIPGNQSFSLDFHSSLRAAKAAFASYCWELDCTNCSMLLYYAGNRQDMYELAKEYEKIGCPFDSPDKLLEYGPRNGIKLVNN